MLALPSTDHRPLADYRHYTNPDDDTLAPFAVGDKVLPVNACVRYHAAERGVTLLTIRECFCSKSPQGPWLWWVRFDEFPASYLASDVRLLDSP
jgi:hypothetical protein